MRAPISKGPTVQLTVSNISFDPELSKSPSRHLKTSGDSLTLVGWTLWFIPIVKFILDGNILDGHLDTLDIIHTFVRLDFELSETVLKTRIISSSD